MRRKEKWIFTGIMLLVMALWLWLAPGCPIRNTTGIPCPGCGMSRAWTAALRLDFASAFSWHPMFWSAAAAFWLFWKDFRPFRRPWLNWTVNLGLVLGLMVCYGCRMYFQLIQS